MKKTDEKQAPKPGTGTLKHGLKIGAALHKEFVLREATTEDLIAAEEEAGPEKQIAFNVALLAIQLERVGTFEGPFTESMVRSLSAVDFWALRRAQVALEAQAGES